MSWPGGLYQCCCGHFTKLSYGGRGLEMIHPRLFCTESKFWIKSADVEGCCFSVICI